MSFVLKYNLLNFAGPSTQTFNKNGCEFNVFYKGVRILRKF